jgi:hypothetical protein
MIDGKAALTAKKQRIELVKLDVYVKTVLQTG